MKIFLLSVAILGFSIANGQNILGSGFTMSSSIFQDQWASIRPAAGNSPYQGFFTQISDGRWVYVDQNDTTYLTREGAGQGQFSTSLLGLVQDHPSPTSIGTFQTLQEIITDLSSHKKAYQPLQGRFLYTGSADNNSLIQYSFFQSANGQTGLAYNGDTSLVGNIVSGAALSGFTTVVSLQGSSNFSGTALSGFIYPIASQGGLQSNISDLVAAVVKDSLASGGYFACSNCYTVAPIQSGDFSEAIHFGPSATDQQFDVNSLTAYNPASHQVWLRASQGTGAGTITDFSVLTGTSQDPNSIAGAINIKFRNGQTFGLATDSTGGMLGWQNFPDGNLTIRAGTIYTAANFVDNGSITTRAITISDFVGAPMAPRPGVQEYLFSNSGLGSRILVENSSNSPDANSTLTLTQGVYSNIITTISAYSRSSGRPAGALYIESEGPNGMVLNATDGAITFCLNNKPVARMDPNEGFVVLAGSLGLRRVTTTEMMEMTGMEPGDQVFNTDRQAIFTYTESGWEWCKIHKFHYREPKPIRQL